MQEGHIISLHLSRPLLLWIFKGCPFIQPPLPQQRRQGSPQRQPLPLPPLPWACWWPTPSLSGLRTQEISIIIIDYSLSYVVVSPSIVANSGVPPELVNTPCAYKEFKIQCTTYRRERRCTKACGSGQPICGWISRWPWRWGQHRSGWPSGGDGRAGACSRGGVGPT